MVASSGRHPATLLAYRRQSAWERMSESEKNLSSAFNEDYKAFLSAFKTEREVTAAAKNILHKAGFRHLEKVITG